MTAALAVLVGIAILAAATDGQGANATFTLSGSLTLIDSGVERLAPGCVGTGGYDDMVRGASVTVYDPSGTVIATGQVHQTEMLDSVMCRLDFEVTDVPDGHAFYQIELSHRGKVTFPVDVAKRRVALSLG